jgi:hypothetical protein
MTTDMEYGIVLFDTTQAAIKAEKVLKKAGIRTKLIPVPRHISSNCGVSLRFDLQLASEVESALAAKRVPIAGMEPLKRTKK